MTVLLMLTISCNRANRDSVFVRHKPQISENNKTRKETSKTIHSGSDKTISENQKI